MLEERVETFHRSFVDSKETNDRDDITVKEEDTTKRDYPFRKTNLFADRKLPFLKIDFYLCTLMPKVCRMYVL